MADIAIPFDTQRTVARLQEAGVRQPQATAIAEGHGEQLVELLKVLVTKAELAEYDANHHKDLAAIRERIAALEASQQARFADVDTEFAKVMASQKAGFAKVMASQKAGFADVDAEFAKVMANLKAGFAEVNQRIAESDANHQKDLRVLADRIAALDAKIDALHLQLIMWMVGVGIGVAGLVVALLRLWPPG